MLPLRRFIRRHKVRLPLINTLSRRPPLLPLFFCTPLFQQTGKRRPVFSYYLLRFCIQVLQEGSVLVIKKKGLVFLTLIHSQNIYRLSLEAPESTYLDTILDFQNVVQYRLRARCSRLVD